MIGKECLFLCLLVFKINYQFVNLIFIEECGLLEDMNEQSTN